MRLFRSLFDGFALWRRAKSHSTLIEALRNRLLFAGVCAVLIFSGISYRLADVMVLSQFIDCRSKNWTSPGIIQKADIVDRNGELLATSITTASCYADPSVVIDIDEAAAKLNEIPGMPGIDRIKQKLSNRKKHFVWLARHITPQLRTQIMDLGIPGVHMLKDYKRIYIHKNLFSHVIGCSDIDGEGIYGLERKFSKQLFIKDATDKRKLVTTLDLRMQAIVHEELERAVKKFGAAGGNAMLMTTNGELIAIVSLPDFNPNNLKSTTSDAMFNRNTLGVFEQGSILKILNVAIAIDSGAASLGTVFDATEPIKIGKYLINDFRGKKRPLTLAEAFVFSSNIASAKIAQAFGASVQKAYMKKFGMLDKPQIEIPEVGRPLIPAHWTEATTMSVAYGYGLAVSPLQLLATVTSIINGGVRIVPTVINRRHPRANDQIRLVSSETSAIVRELMRSAVCYGTAKKASIDGTSIFGKTGTAYKVSGRGYGSDSTRKRITTFIGGFPSDDPQYMLLVTLDDPKPSQETFGYVTAGWNVAPAAHDIFNRIVPILCESVGKASTPIKVLKYVKLEKR
ncbi:MAG: penicillin-binding protein 2 [Holosporales bacterium]|jgi:cell division protein FtsI (penicillin-binding protein 3)|nr:penicillin-binding protein 2 [Holosporales bacterium]